MDIKSTIGKSDKVDLYNKYASDPPPFDVVGFAKSLGISVKESNDLPPRVSGFIKTIDSKVVICVNKKECEARQRFTIAHELGHYFLHTDKIPEGIVDGIDTLNRDGKINQMENEANEFAAELLMPKFTFTQLWQDKNVSTDNIALFFNVSLSAVSIRAIKLGLANSDYVSYFS